MRDPAPVRNLWNRSARTVDPPSQPRFRQSPQDLHTRTFHKPANSFERFDEAADEPVEILVDAAPLVDLPDGMNHGGMMLPAEELPDGRKGLLRQVLAKVHGDLPWKGDIPRVVL